MPGIDALYERFTAAYEAGEPIDLPGLLGQADEADRQKLHERIDSFLMTAPRRKWNAAAYADSAARVGVERAFESLEGVGGTWPQLLPALRHRARIIRTELVQRLADALGVGDRADKVGDYYHAMEHGQLPASGVSDRVIDALAELLGSTADALRRAGSLGSGDLPGQATVFTRYALREGDGDAPPAPAADQPPDGEPDEVDELFTGG